jgi:hypothetical protein
VSSEHRRERGSLVDAIILSVSIPNPAGRFRDEVKRGGTIFIEGFRERLLDPGALLWVRLPDTPRPGEHCSRNIVVTVIVPPDLAGHRRRQLLGGVPFDAPVAIDDEEREPVLEDRLSGTIAVGEMDIETFHCFSVSFFIASWNENGANCVAGCFAQPWN